MGIIIIIFPTWELSLPHILLVPPSVRGCILSQLAQSRMYKDHKPKKLTFGWMLISGKKMLMSSNLKFLLTNLFI